MENVQSIVMYSAYSTYFGLLSMEERGRLISAIFDYAFNDRESEGLSPAAYMAYSFIRDQLDRDREKYEKTCEQRRRYGSMGGRPSKAKAQAEPQSKKEASFDTDDFFAAAVKSYESGAR